MAWTSPATPIAGTAITVAFWNVNGRDNLNYLRGLLPDPPGAGSFLRASSTTTAAFVASTSLTDNITTTGNLTGAAISGTTGTFSSNVTVSGQVNASSYTGGSTAVGTVSVLGLTAGASGVAVSGAGGINVSGGGAYQGGTKSAGTNLLVIGLSAGANGIASDGAISGTAISGTTGTFGSDITAVKGTFSGDLTTAANLNALGTATITSAVGASRYISNIADGATPPFVANAAQAGIACTNVRAESAVTATTATTANAVATLSVTDAGVAAANKDGAAGTPSLRTLGTGAQQAAAGNHTHTATSADGSYPGNSGGARVIANALAFQPRMVVVSTNGNTTAIVLRDNNWRGIVAGGSGVSLSGGSIDAAGFTVPSGLNTTGSTYTWSAFA